MKIRVYLLRFENEDGIYPYIGGTCDPEQREQQHLEQLANGSHPSRRCRDAYALCGRPTFVVLAAAIVATAEAAAELETRWIQQYAADYPDRYLNRALTADPRPYRVYEAIPDDDLAWSQTA